MSYDVDLFVGLGVPVKTIVAAIASSSQPSVEIAESSYPYVQITEELVAEYQALQSANQERFSHSIDDLSPTTAYPTDTGTCTCFAQAMLAKCGVKPEMLRHFSSNDLRLIPYGGLFVPTKDTTSHLPIGYVYLESQSTLFNEWLIPSLREAHLITAFEMEYDDDYNNKPLLDVDFGASLERLLDAQKATRPKDDYTGPDYGPENMMHILVCKYLESKEVWMDVEIASTRFGDVMDYGGMEKDEPYVFFAGLGGFEEGEWDDPRENDPETLEMALDALLGAEREAVSVLQPKFGG